MHYLYKDESDEDICGDVLIDKYHDACLGR